MKKQKLLFVINTMGRAGAETALAEMLKKLVSLDKYLIDLYVIVPRGEIFARVPSEVRILNSRYSEKSVLSFSGRMAVIRKTCQAFFWHGTGFFQIGDIFSNIRRQRQESGRVLYEKVLWRLLSSGSPPPKDTYDLAVAYIEGAATYYVADKVKARHKAAFLHIDYQKAGYKPWMDKGCYDRIDRVFVVSREVGKKFTEVYPQYAEKVFQFNNILDVDGIRKKAREPGFTDGFDGVRLVTVGRLHYQKGYDIAIQACALLKQRGYRVRWYVIGEGAERAKLEKQISEAGLDSDFVLMGVKDNPYPFVREADIYVHATRFEGKSIAIDEAQILGKAIVASNCTGNTEQITDGVDGILLELTPENLAGALARVIDDENLRSSLAYQSQIKERDWKKDMNLLLSLLDRPEQAQEEDTEE